MKILLRVGFVLLIIGIMGTTVTAFAAKDDLEENLLSETLIYERNEIEDINLTISNNPVVIYPSEDNQIKIVIIYEKYETLSIDKNEHKLNINVTSKWSDQFFNGFGLFNLTSFMFDRTIKVYLPDELYNLKIKTSNGSIKANDMILNYVSLRTSNGKIDVSNSTFNTIDVYTSNGPVDLNRVNALKADLDTSNGSINIKEVSINDITGKTSNGNISGSMITGNFINLSTSNGNINLGISGSFEDYKVTTKTSNGNVKFNNVTYGSDIYNKNKSLSITAKTSNGNINLNFSND